MNSVYINIPRLYWKNVTVLINSDGEEVERAPTVQIARFQMFCVNCFFLFFVFHSLGPKIILSRLTWPGAGNIQSITTPVWCRNMSPSQVNIPPPQHFCLDGAKKYNSGQEKGKMSCLRTVNTDKNPNYLLIWSRTLRQLHRSQFTCNLDDCLLRLLWIFYRHHFLKNRQRFSTGRLIKDIPSRLVL